MKTALCLGINNYPGSANDLQGCVNDANGWATLLRSLGFDVILLLDGEVTINRVTTEISNLVNSLNADDVGVITYSGHGTQVIDVDSDEDDGYDEALYLYDGVLKDDTLRDAIQFAPVSAQLVFIMDSCFSGTATRALLSENIGRHRYVETDEIPATFPLRRSLKGLAEEEMIDILIAGCSDSEYSYDAYINGKWTGAFSAYALQSFQNGQTFNEFYDVLRTHLPTNSYPQTPQLEGSAERKEWKMFEELEPAETPVEPPIELPTEIPQVTGITFTAVESAYWVVVLNGVVQTPRHSQQFEAAEHAINLLLSDTTADVRIIHNGEYLVKIK